MIQPVCVKCKKSGHKKVAVRELSSVALMSWPICVVWLGMAYVKTHSEELLYIYSHLNNICDYLFILTYGLRLIQLKKKNVAGPSNEIYIRYRSYCHHHVVKCAHKRVCVCVCECCSCKAWRPMNHIIIYTFAQTHVACIYQNSSQIKSYGIQTSLFFYGTIFECK